MTLYTKADLRRASYRASKQYSEKELRALSESASSASQFDIFLSHSFLDAQEILGLKTILEELRYSVYIDWIEDAQLDRASVSSSTADVLRRRMKQSRCLFFATSKNHSSSKWMPWELGYFDALKGKAAIFPISEVDGQSSFRGQEYLGLYPYIRKGAQTALIVQGTTDFDLFTTWLYR